MLPQLGQGHGSSLAGGVCRAGAGVDIGVRFSVRVRVRVELRVKFGARIWVRVGKL